jgi:serine/threonine protein kinase
MWQAPSVEEMQAMLPQYEILDDSRTRRHGRRLQGTAEVAEASRRDQDPAAGCMADDEMRFVERFENEAQTMAAMNHPAIVSVYDFGETADGLLYFIMEFVDGTDVQKMIQSQREAQRRVRAGDHGARL